MIMQTVLAQLFKYMTKVVIATEAKQKFLHGTYLLRYLCEEWKQQGINVQLSSWWQFPPGDIGLLHVDITKVPYTYQYSLKRCPIVLNRYFTDNSKRRVSKNLVHQRDSYSGPVIIKTDANYGGFLEVHRSQRMHDLSLTQTDWRHIQSIIPSHYLVVDSKNEVPATVWQNKYLVVEKFLPEIGPEGHYVMRACLFFGDREVNLMVTSKSPVIKGDNVEERKIIEQPAPVEVQRLKQTLKMDFGRIDYVFSKHGVVVFDANKTATLSRQASIEWREQIILPLASGIETIGLNYDK